MNEFKPKSTEIANCPQGICPLSTWFQFWAMWCHYFYTSLANESKVLQIVNNTIFQMYFIGFEWI